MNTALFILPVVLGLAMAAGITIFVMKMLKSSGAFGPSKDQQAKAQYLQTNGTKARAQVAMVQPTGVVVNNFNHQCVVVFNVTSLDGSVTFSGQKTILVNQMAAPRIGDVWPCWFDPADHSSFAVAQAGAITPDTQRLFAEFGIPMPGTGGVG